MAICADENALVEFFPYRVPGRDYSLPWKTEALARPILMVEFQRRVASVVATKNALATLILDCLCF